jgi:hypothetical protein
MALSLEADEVHNIMQIRSFGPEAHLLEPPKLTDFVEEGGRLE